MRRDFIEVSILREHVVIQHIRGGEVLDGDIYVVSQHIRGGEVLDGDIYVVIQHIRGDEVLDGDMSSQNTHLNKSSPHRLM